jgi:hypothetical protein
MVDINAWSLLESEYFELICRLHLALDYLEIRAERRSRAGYDVELYDRDKGGNIVVRARHDDGLVQPSVIRNFKRYIDEVRPVAAHWSPRAGSV